MQHSGDHLLPWVDSSLSDYLACWNTSYLKENHLGFWEYLGWRLRDGWRSFVFLCWCKWRAWDPPLACFQHNIFSAGPVQTCEMTRGLCRIWYPSKWSYSASCIHFPRVVKFRFHMMQNRQIKLSWNYLLEFDLHTPVNVRYCARNAGMWPHIFPSIERQRLEPANPHCDGAMFYMTDAPPVTVLTQWWMKQIGPVRSLFLKCHTGLISTWLDFWKPESRCCSWRWVRFCWAHIRLYTVLF